MEYLFIVIYIVLAFLFFKKFPKFRITNSWALILFFVLIFYKPVFENFTIWKAIALAAFIGSLIYDLYRTKPAKTGQASE